MNASPMPGRVAGTAGREGRTGRWWAATAVLSALCLVLWSETAQAIGFGALRVESHLDEPLRARVDLHVVTEQELETLFVGIADLNTYHRAGLNYPADLQGLKLELRRAGPGSGGGSGGSGEAAYFVSISSRSPIREPILELLLEVDWSGGRLVRKYSLLLDPRGYSLAPRVPLSGVPVAAPAPRPATAQVAPPPPPDPDLPGDAVPAAREDLPAPQRAQQRGFPGDTFGPTRKGDTLWAIALQLRQEGQDLQRIMQSLARANQEAFFLAGNINALKTGQVLRVPSGEEMEELSSAEALAMSRRHQEDWQRYLATKNLTVRPETVGRDAAPPEQRPAPPAAPDAQDAAQDIGEAPRGEIRVVGADLAGGVTGAVAQAGGIPEEARRELLLLREQLTSMESERDEAEDRLEKSKTIQQDQQRLLELRDEELMNIQNRLRESREQLQQIRGQPGETQAAPIPEPDAELPEPVDPGTEGAGAEEASELSAEESTAAAEPSAEPGVAEAESGEVSFLVTSLSAVAGLFASLWGLVLDNLLPAGALLLLVLMVPPVLWSLRRRAAARQAEAETWVSEDQEKTELGVPEKSDATVTESEQPMLTEATQGPGQEAEIQEWFAADKGEPATITKTAEEAAETPPVDITLAPVAETIEEAPEADSAPAAVRRAEETGGEDLSLEDLEEMIDMTDLPEFDAEVAPHQEGAGDNDARMAEINVLIAYEQYDRAAEFVREALKEDPDNVSYHLKLLEVYGAMNDESGFEAAAHIFHDKVGGQGEAWQATQEMWSKLSPDRELFQESEQEMLAATQRISDEGSRALKEQADSLVEENYGLEFGAAGVESPRQAVSEEPGAEEPVVEVLELEAQAEVSDDELKTALDIFKPEGDKADAGAAAEAEAAPPKEDAPESAPGSAGEISLEVEQADSLDDIPIADVADVADVAEDDEGIEVGEEDLDESEIDEIHETLIETLGEEEYKARVRGLEQEQEELESGPEIAPEVLSIPDIPAGDEVELVDTISGLLQGGQGDGTVVAEPEEEVEVLSLPDEPPEPPLPEPLPELGDEPPMAAPEAPLPAKEKVAEASLAEVDAMTVSEAELDRTISELMQGKLDRELESAVGEVDDSLVGQTNAVTVTDSSVADAEEADAAPGDAVAEVELEAALDGAIAELEPVTVVADAGEADAAPGDAVAEVELEAALDGAIAELEPVTVVADAGEADAAPGDAVAEADIEGEVAVAKLASTLGEELAEAQKETAETPLFKVDSMTVSDAELDSTISELMDGLPSGGGEEVAAGVEEKVELDEQDITATSEIEHASETGEKADPGKRAEPKVGARLPLEESVEREETTDTFSVDSPYEPASPPLEQTGEAKPASESILVSEKELDSTITNLFVSDGEWEGGLRRPLEELVGATGQQDERIERTEISPAPPVEQAARREVEQNDSVTITQILAEQEPPASESYLTRTAGSSNLLGTDEELHMDLSREHSEENLSASSEDPLAGEFVSRENTISVLSGLPQGAEEEEEKISDDEIDIQLDLVRAYVELGDKQSAKISIEDILSGAPNQEQQQSARDLLKKIEGE